MLASPTKIHKMKANPQCDSIRKWDWEIRLSHKGGARVNEMSVLIKETPESSLSPSTMWAHSGKMVIYEPGSRPSLDTESVRTLVLDLRPPELCMMSWHSSLNRLGHLASTHFIPIVHPLPPLTTNKSISRRCSIYSRGGGGVQTTPHWKPLLWISNIYPAFILCQALPLPCDTHFLFNPCNTVGEKGATMLILQMRKLRLRGGGAGCWT